MAMAKLVGTWNIPAGASVEAVDEHYLGVHVPNVRRIPGVRRHVVQRGLSDASGGHPAFYRAAEVWFDDAAALSAALQSPEWRDEEKNDGFIQLVSGLQTVTYEIEEVWEP